MGSLYEVFGFDQTARLALVSEWRLISWCRSEFITPSINAPDLSVPSSWLYSLRDVVGLRTLGLLRAEVPLSRLRPVASLFATDSPNHRDWIDLVFYVIDRRVHCHHARRGIHHPFFVRHGRSPVFVGTVWKDLMADIQSLSSRNPAQIGAIDRIPGHAATFAGTRVPVRAILEFHRARYSIAEILREYPTLVPADIEAAIAYEGVREPAVA